MKKVIVTGANGFIGSSLIKKLISNNIEVLAIDISFNDSHLPKSQFIRTLEIELNDIDIMLENISYHEYDSFYHLAWQGVNGIDKANPSIQIYNMQMAINCATVAKTIGCSKFLCAGTIAEQSVNSLSNINKTSGGMIYGIAKYCTHLILETYCKNIELDFVWMQFSNIYGPDNKTGNLVSYTINELLNGNIATFGPALQPYDFIYADDLIEAVYRLGNCNTSQNNYYIGSGNPQILKDYLLEIGKIYGRVDLIKIGIRPDDEIKYTIDMFDISKLVNDIGDYVSISFTDGIKTTLAKY